MALANIPHRFVDEIRTPMLVVHGDTRLPGADRRGAAAVGRARPSAAQADGEMPHKFLYFPDENHWVLTPQHAKVWYSTVFAFLDHTVHGKEWETPDILR